MRSLAIGGKRELIEKANTTMFAAVAIASIIAAFSLVALNFMWDQAQYNNRVNDAKESARDILDNNIQNATSLRQSLLELNNKDDIIPGQDGKSNTAVVLDALPRKYDFPALRTSIDKLADISGVKLVGFNGSDIESDALKTMVDPIPQEVSFSINVEGDYDSVKQLLEDIENTIRPVRITRVRMSGTDSNMSANFDLITYYQPSVDVDIQTEVIE